MRLSLRSRSKVGLMYLTQPGIRLYALRGFYCFSHRSNTNNSYVFGRTMYVSHMKGCKRYMQSTVHWEVSLPNQITGASGQQWEQNNESRATRRVGDCGITWRSWVNSLNPVHNHQRSPKLQGLFTLTEMLHLKLKVNLKLKVSLKVNLKLKVN